MSDADRIRELERSLDMTMVIIGALLKAAGGKVEVPNRYFFTHAIRKAKIREYQNIANNTTVLELVEND